MYPAVVELSTVTHMENKFQPISKWYDDLFWYKNVGQQLGPRLLTWVNFNSSMHKQSQPTWNVGWNYLSIPKHQRSYRENDK